MNADSIFDSEAIHNPHLEEDTMFGLHPCKLTGKFHGDYHVEVELKYGIRQTARILFPFPFFGVPNADWLEKNADKLIGYVAYERGVPDKMLLVAVSFRETADNFLNDFPNSVVVLSTKFMAEMNDSQNKYILTYLDGGKGYIGSKDANEQMVLGNKLVKAMNDLTDKVSDLVTAVSAIKVPVPSFGVSVVSPDDIIKIQKIGVEIATVKAKYNDFLSTKTYVE